MLHCPRCSGPLQVAEEAEPEAEPEAKPETASAPAAASACPAGCRCPHFKSDQRAANYLSGGCIIDSRPPASGNAAAACRRSLSFSPADMASAASVAGLHPNLSAAAAGMDPTRRCRPQSAMMWPHAHALPDASALMPFMVFNGGQLMPILLPAATWLPPAMMATAATQHPTTMPQQQHVVPATVEVDIHDILQRNKADLEQCGWYYSGLSCQDATAMLESSPEGTFLVRDSSAAGFMFSLTVQKEAGPTSVRIHFQNGLFRLDAVDSIWALMPGFPSVISLVEFYLRLPTQNQRHVWIDAMGQPSSPICLRRPHLKAGPHSLKHLCRLAANKRLLAGTDAAAAVTTLELPVKLKDFLVQYQHAV